MDSLLVKRFAQRGAGRLERGDALFVHNARIGVVVARPCMEAVLRAAYFRQLGIEKGL